MVNKVILVGSLGADPELRTLDNGTSLATFSLATSKSWKDKDGNKQSKTEWHNCIAWRKPAEIINQYAYKGSKLYVEGELSTEKYEKDGVARYSTKIVVNTFQFLGGGNQKETSPKGPTEHNENYEKDVPGGPVSPDLMHDETDDLPF